MQKNSAEHSLPENFTVKTAEELEVLLQQAHAEHLAVLHQLSEARSQIKAVREAEAALALDAKLKLIEIDKKAWAVVRDFLRMFESIVAGMPPSTDPAAQRGTRLALEVFS